MSSAGKADKKATIDAASWMFNVVTSVGIIIVNKALMATYGFSFGMSILAFSTIFWFLWLFFSILQILNNKLLKPSSEETLNDKVLYLLFLEKIKQLITV